MAKPNAQRGFRAPSEWWLAEHQHLMSFLDALGVTKDVENWLIRLIPLGIESPQELQDEVRRHTEGDGDWATAVYVDELGQTGSPYFAVAMPLAKEADPQFLSYFPYVEVHSAVIAWWLMTAWRVRQLAEACLDLVNADALIPAAACSRSLLETAASFHSDACKFERTWLKIKRSGTPDTLDHYRITAPIREALFGAKFDEKTPALQARFPVKRTSTYTDIERIDRLGFEGLLDDYAWLCNTVHPSLGNYRTFTAKPLPGATLPSYTATFMSGNSRPPSWASEIVMDETVPRAIDRATSLALRIMTYNLDAVLRLADDLALTTKAPPLSRLAYWGIAKPPADQSESCPCRSGRTWAECEKKSHRWGAAESPAPPIYKKKAARGDQAP